MCSLQSCDTRLPGVDAHGREVQLVFGLEDERLGADLQDGWRLQWCGDGEQGELRGHQRPVLRHPVLTVEELEAAAEVQGLRTSACVYVRVYQQILKCHPVQFKSHFIIIIMADGF